jgi:hypothetical protein
MVAPKGSGLSVRRNYLEGSGINSSFAIHQDYTGRAEERALALGIAMGSGYLFYTTFKKEVYSDLVGERGVLMGAIAGIMEAQYNELRKHGHSPSEAFNETVEELTQSLIRLVDENGMDWMYANCSATAQRGALDWKPKFKKAVMPVFKELYQRVASGEETRRVIRSCGRANYKTQLGKELSTIPDNERHWYRVPWTDRVGQQAFDDDDCLLLDSDWRINVDRNGVLHACAIRNANPDFGKVHTNLRGCPNEEGQGHRLAWPESTNMEGIALKDLKSSSIHKDRFNEYWNIDS